MSGEQARAVLVQGLAELRLEVETNRVEALLRLAEMVAGWGRRLNLSGHRTVEGVIRRLVLEAAALMLEAPEFDSLVDLGSGAGFPGLPIAILRPRVPVTLVEARLRRHHFQRAATRELDLGNVRLLRGRAEELAPRAHAAVVAQAIAHPTQAVAWMLPWAEPDGLLLLPGSEAAPEVAGGGFRLEAIRRYRLPCGGSPRTLWIGRRTSRP
jgi:16S rRNA (guanine527-N7)-methyltransferase